jgi:hypothetical protein
MGEDGFDQEMDGYADHEMTEQRHLDIVGSPKQKIYDFGQ